MEKVYGVGEIKSILNPIFDSYPVHRAMLFGSYARGEANGLSDVDMLIDSQGELKGIRFFELWAILEESINKVIDLVEAVELRKDTPIYENIQREGVLIYERNG
jgi:hypothetical protein